MSISQGNRLLATSLSAAPQNLSSATGVPFGKHRSIPVRKPSASDCQFECESPGHLRATALHAGTGERLINLERAYNIREGLTRADDYLPERFLKDAMKEGNTRGQTVKLDPMLDRYYEVRGWDKQNGIPGRTKLRELGLADVAQELSAMGKMLPD